MLPWGYIYRYRYRYRYISKDRYTHTYNLITSFGSFLSGKAVARKKSLHKVPPTINSDLVEREVANPQIPNSHPRDSNPVVGLGEPQEATLVTSSPSWV